MDFNRLCSHLMSETTATSIDLPETMNYIKSFIETKLGKKLYRYGGSNGVEMFENENGKEIGIRYFIESTNDSIRFNIDKLNNVTSVDIWNNNAGTYPSMRMILKDANINKLLPTITSVIKNTNLGKLDVILDEAIMVNGKSYESKRDAVTDLLKADDADPAAIVKSVGVSPDFVAFVAKAIGKKINVPSIKAEPEKAPEKVEVVPGKKEVMSPEKVAKVETQVKNELKKIEDTEEFDVFEDIKLYTNMVIENKIYALLITGQPGVGKTYVVTSTIEDHKPKLVKDYDWIHITGTSTAKGLYKTLFTYDTSLLVFDDCDSVLEDKTSIQILRGALNSSKTRAITWESESAKMFDARGMTMDEIKKRNMETGEFPNTFMFSGKCIFISNKPKAKFDEAITSRSIVIEVNLSPKQVLGKIEQVLPKIMPEFPMEYKQDVLDYFKQNPQLFEKPGVAFNLRSFIKGVESRATGSPDWKGLIRRYTLN